MFSWDYIKGRPCVQRRYGRAVKAQQKFGINWRGIESLVIVLRLGRSEFWALCGPLSILSGKVRPRPLNSPNFSVNKSIFEALYRNLITNHQVTKKESRMRRLLIGQNIKGGNEERSIQLIWWRTKVFGGHKTSVTRIEQLIYQVKVDDQKYEVTERYWPGIMWVLVSRSRARVIFRWSCYWPTEDLYLLYFALRENCNMNSEFVEWLCSWSGRSRFSWNPTVLNPAGWRYLDAPGDARDTSLKRYQDSRLVYQKEQQNRSIDLIRFGASFGALWRLRN